jgi:hypothetical protein
VCGSELRPRHRHQPLGSVSGSSLGRHLTEAGFAPNIELARNLRRGRYWALATALAALLTKINSRAESGIICACGGSYSDKAHRPCQFACGHSLREACVAKRVKVAADAAATGAVEGLNEDLIVTCPSPSCQATIHHELIDAVKFGVASAQQIAEAKPTNAVLQQLAGAAGQGCR